MKRLIITKNENEQIALVNFYRLLNLYVNRQIANAFGSLIEINNLRFPNFRLFVLKIL